MKIHFFGDRLALACWIVVLGLSVQAKWPSRRRAYGDRPTWKHFSIVLQMPWTYFCGWHFNPLRFGFYHDGSRAHLYLGVIYLNGDIGYTKGPRHMGSKRVGPFEIARAELGHW